MLNYLFVFLAQMTRLQLSCLTLRTKESTEEVTQDWLTWSIDCQGVFLRHFCLFFCLFLCLELKRIRWLQTIKWCSLRADSRDQRFSTSVSSLRERMRPARAERSSRGLAPSQIHGKPFPDSPRRNARLAALVMRSCPQTTDKDNSSSFFSHTPYRLVS